MQLHYYVVYILLFIGDIAYSIEYVYPIASLNNGEIILLIHQLSSQKIELLRWNIQTDTIEQILWSLFNPAGLQLLSDQSGFSFIDNGRLRIQSFNKRSPRSIDFDEPILNINSLQWINNYSCYCSAQQGDDYALFQLNIDGAVQCIGFNRNKDYLYPQKIGDNLFYIERDKSDCMNNYYHIIMNAQKIIDFHTHPIIFLRMQSDQEGFVIEHSAKVDSNDTVIHFIYYHIKQYDRSWIKQPLFSFDIPCYLLIHDNEEALYESIVPLLPNAIGNIVYFVDCSFSNDNTLELYCYDLLVNTYKKVITPCVIQGHCFVPMLCNNILYCGGTQQKGKKLLAIPFLT